MRVAGSPNITASQSTPADGEVAFDATFEIYPEVTLKPLADAEVTRAVTPVDDAAGYAALLTAAGASVDAWETTYLHRLTGADPVLTWITGTALRPVKAALDPDAWTRFRGQLAPILDAMELVLSDEVMTALHQVGKDIPYPMG